LLVAIGTLSLPLLLTLLSGIRLSLNNDHYMKPPMTGESLKHFITVL